MNSGSFKNCCLLTIRLKIIYIYIYIYIKKHMYMQDLAIDNIQGLICRKT